MDPKLLGMEYASVEHPPVLGQKLESYDDKAALQVRGVKQTVAIDPFKPPHQFQPLGGVAVIADNTLAAFQGRKALKIEWSSSPNSVCSSASFRKTLEATARQPVKVARNVGEVDAEFAKGGKIVEAEYYTPHLAHASMETPVAVHHWPEWQTHGMAATLGVPTYRVHFRRQRDLCNRRDDPGLEQPSARHPQSSLREGAGQCLRSHRLVS
jgi:isoquinoline 1-oxidoreductase beta subunit